jgi:hypothetical protein
MMRSVATDPVSPWSAGLQSIIAGIWGPTHIATSYYGSSYLGGNSAVGMPFNQVSSATPLQSMTYEFYHDSSDLGNVPYGPSTAIEGWPWDSSTYWATYISGTGVTVTHGSPTVTGIGTAFLSQVLAGDQYCFGESDAASVLYTILSVQTDTSLSLTANYAGSNASGVGMYGPYNRPPVAELNGDSRILALIADSSTGLPIKLYEDYEVWSPDGGTTWFANFGQKLDLTTGAQRKDGLTSTTAAGTPCMPFLVRYEEAASGLITHPLRGIIGSAISVVNQCVWPALHGVSVGGTDYTQGYLPQGARLRLGASWWAANRASYSAINQAIGDAMATYGLTVSDLTSGVPIWIDVAPDSRWSKIDLQELWGIPVTAFEVVDTIKPQYTLSASSAITTTSTPITLTAAYAGGNNTNFGPLSVYLYWSTDLGSSWHATGMSAPSVTLSNSSTTGSVTWTPPGAGNYLLWASISGQGVYWVPPPNLSVAVSVSSRALTTSQAGRWDDPTTWGGVAPPTAGDSATVAHAVRMVGDVTLGTGAATTCLTVATGSLTVVGCKLTLRGNATIGQTSGTQVTASPLTVLSSAGNPAGIEFDGSSGVTPTMSVSNDTLLTFTGTSSAHAFLRTKTGTAGNMGIVASTGTARSFYANFTWCDFTNLGTASTAAITASHVSTSSNLANPPWIMSNCTVTGCGQLPVISIQDGAVNCQFTGTTWSSPADTVNWFCMQLGTSGAISTGTRLIHDCQFLGSAPQIVNVQDFTITQNWFDPYLLGGKSQPQWASFDGNFMHMTTNYEIQMGGGWSNCFWLHDPPSPSIWPTVLMGQYTSCACVGNIYQSLTTSGGGGNCMSGGEGVPTARTLTRTNNIILPNSAGDQSANVTNSDQNVPDLPYCAVDAANHNTVYMGTGVGAIAGFSTKPAIPGYTSSFMNNLFWTNTPQSPSAYAGYILSCQETNPYSYPDPVSAANCDYNAAWGAATVPAGTWTSSAPAANGTLYNIPMTSTPGAHDIILGSAPPFTDAARNIQKWDTYMGGPGTVASALARIKANLALVKTSLLPYIQAGFTLTGSGSLINSGSDGFNRGYDPRATS